MTTLRNEHVAVQSPFTRYAQDAGWAYLSRDDALRLRRGDTGLLLGDVLTGQLQQLNPEVMNEARAQAVAAAIARVPPTIEGNLQGWEYLSGLKTVLMEEEERPTRPNESKPRFAFIRLS